MYVHFSDMAKMLDPWHLEIIFGQVVFYKIMEET